MEMKAYGKPSHRESLFVCLSNGITKNDDIAESKDRLSVNWNFIKNVTRQQFE